MKPTQIVKEFENLAQQMNIRIVQGKGSFTSGYCIVEEEPVIVINRNKPVEHRLKCLINVFSKMKLDNIYVKPVLRKLIEQETSLFEDN